jgi:hypothetical protein
MQAAWTKHTQLAARGKMPMQVKPHQPIDHRALESSGGGGRMTQNLRARRVGKKKGGGRALAVHGSPNGAGAISWPPRPQSAA